MNKEQSKKDSFWEISTNITRRDLLKVLAASGAAAALPGSMGCSSMAVRKLPELDYSGELRLENCSLVDVKKGTVIPGAVVRIRDGKIVFAGPRVRAGELAAAKGVEVLDMENRYIMPGFINGHVHMTLPGTSSFSVFNTASFYRQLRRSFVLELESGVTTVRDMASLPVLLQDYIDLVEEGSLPGPRVVRGTPFVTIKDGYPDINPSTISIFTRMSTVLYGSLNTAYTDLDDLKEKLADALANASFIKIATDHTSTMCGRGRIPTYSHKQLAYIFDVAAKKKLPVSCHVLMKEGLARVLKYPVATIEHLPSDGFISDEELKTMSDKKIAVIPTCILGNLYLLEEAFKELPPEYETEDIKNELKIRKEYWDSITEKDCEPFVHESNREAISLFRKMTFKEIYESGDFLVNPHLGFKGVLYGKNNIQKIRDAGLRVGCGTDAGVPMNYHGTIWRELEIMSRLGFTNHEILKCLTLNNAAICGMEDKIGSLDPGKFADLVVLKKNPLKDITACRKPDIVFKEGKVAALRTENIQLKQNKIK
ncbi:MAG: amidohydrolase family protein [bacterium]|nr:amidohydrolase family protein [bacterium]